MWTYTQDYLVAISARIAIKSANFNNCSLEKDHTDWIMASATQEKKKTYE